MVLVLLRNACSSPKSGPSQRLMGIGKKMAIDLKIANTMHLRGISVALFEVGGPSVSPSLVMRKQQEH